MTAIKEQFSSNPYFDKFYVVTGSASFVGFPTGTAKLFRMKADPDNVGTFFVGDVITGVGVFPIDAGDDTGWNPAGGGGMDQGGGNLEHLGSSNPSGTLDTLCIWVQD